MRGYFIIQQSRYLPWLGGRLYSMLGSFHYANLPGFRAFRPPRTCPDAPGIPSGKAVLLSFLHPTHLFICWTISLIELQPIHALDPSQKLVKSPQCTSLTSRWVIRLIKCMEWMPDSWFGVFIVYSGHKLSKKLGGDVHLGPLCILMRDALAPR